MINEGLKELRRAFRQHKRDVLRVSGTARSWAKEKNKILLPAVGKLGAAGLFSSPAISLLLHGKLHKPTMIATTAIAAGIVPVYATLKHLKDITKIYIRATQRRKKMAKMNEAYHTSIPSQYEYDKVKGPIDIYKNPHRGELHKLIRESEHGVLRGLLSPEADGHSLYVWDAGRGAIHGDVKEELNLWRSLHVTIHKSRKVEGAIDLATEGDTEGVKNHPWVKKNLPNTTVYQS